MSGQVLQYFYNGHADVTALIDEKGAITASYYYDAFGNVVEETGSVQNPYRYRGYEYDPETKHYYLKSRYYNPKIARFISEDTYRGDRRDPLSLNLYTYCTNEPIMYVDPDGHRAVQPYSSGDGKRKPAVKSSKAKPTPPPKKASKQTIATKPTKKPVVKTTTSKVNKKLTPKIVNKKKDTHEVNYNTKGKKSSSSNKNTKAKDNKENWASKHPVLHATARSSAEGTADAIIVDGVIKNLKTFKKSITEIPSLGVAMELEIITVKRGVKAIKGASKIAGPVAIASYGYDVYQDVKKYNGKDIAKAVTVTTTGTLLTLGAGLAVSGAGAPVGVAIITGVIVSVVVGHISDRIKKKWIGK